MKNLLLFTFLILFLSSCEKTETLELKQEPITTSQVEDPNIEIPAFSAVLTTNGNIRVITITGQLTDLSFHKHKGGPQWGALSYWFDLDFDNLKETKKGPRDAPSINYTFKRNSAYNYTFTHTIESGENYLFVAKNYNNLNDTRRLEY